MLMAIRSNSFFIKNHQKFNLSFFLSLGFGKPAFLNTYNPSQELFLEKQLLAKRYDLVKQKTFHQTNCAKPIAQCVNQTKTKHCPNNSRTCYPEISFCSTSAAYSRIPLRLRFSTSTTANHSIFLALTKTGLTTEVAKAELQFVNYSIYRRNLPMLSKQYCGL